MTSQVQGLCKQEMLHKIPGLASHYGHIEYSHGKLREQNSTSLPTNMLNIGNRLETRGSHLQDGAASLSKE